MKKRTKFLLIALAAVLLAAILVVPVFAAGGTPPTGACWKCMPGIANQEVPLPAVAVLNAEFLAFLVALTGFFKEQFGLKGKAVLGVAFGVGLALYFAPLLSFAPVIDQIVVFLKWFLAGLGAFDTTVNVLKQVGTKK